VELLKSDLRIEIIFCSESFHDENYKLFGRRPFEICTEEELTKAGSFENNNAAIAIVAIPEKSNLSTLPFNEIVLILDGIRDPGNLGTIIRTADWYGINHIICSNDTTDVYSPKVIAATMGSFARVQVEYMNLVHFFEDFAPEAVFGAFLEGESIYKANLNASKGICIVIGNESQGIDKTIEPYISQKIHIPGTGRAESLNAGIATAIILDNFYRCSLK
jgi:TrmH family RNA methyltransferase